MELTLCKLESPHFSEHFDTKISCLQKMEFLCHSLLELLEHIWHSTNKQSIKKSKIISQKCHFYIKSWWIILGWSRDWKTIFAYPKHIYYWKKWISIFSPLWTYLESYLQTSFLICNLWLILLDGLTYECISIPKLQRHMHYTAILSR